MSRFHSKQSILMTMLFSLFSYFAVLFWEPESKFVNPSQLSSRKLGIVTSQTEKEPSYIKLCRAYLSESPIIVEEGESSSVCHDNDFSFWSLLNIFASSLIAQAGMEQRFGILYEHNCQASYPSTGEYTRVLATTNLQQNLPTEINFSIDKEQLKDAVEKNCVDWRKDFQNQKISTVSLLFETSEEITNSVLQTFKLVLQKTIQQSKEKATAVGSHYSTYEEEFDGAVIILGPESIAIPLYIYASYIPPSVLKISILATPFCNQELNGCVEHGSILKRTLSMMYPRANVNFEIVESSLSAYTRMIGCKHLICPSGHSCLLPALLRETQTHNVIIQNDILYPWFTSLSFHSLSNLVLLPMDVVPYIEIGYGEGKLSPSFDPLNEFLTQSPSEQNKFFCQHLRGRLGSWMRDMEYAQKSQYVTPLRQFSEISFEPSNDQPFPPATTYRWVENLFTTCNVNLMEREPLCGVLEVLDIKRIFIIGDSLSLQMAQSLWKLLLNEDDPSPLRRDPLWRPWSRFDWSRIVKCQSSSFEFEISFIRNDHLNGNTNPVVFEKIGQNYNCGKFDYCFPWIERYLTFPHRSLILANMGTHIHSGSEFRRVFDEFLELLELYRKESDIVLLRTLSPGHTGCNDMVEAFTTHSEFEQTLNADYKSWHKFSSYNDYIHRKVYDYSGPLTLKVLDIYPMTVLRPDGHLGGPVTCRRCKQDDCLHYTLPGPVDWWSHLMFSYLQDLAADKLASEGSKF